MHPLPVVALVVVAEFGVEGPASGDQPGLGGLDLILGYQQVHVAEEPPPCGRQIGQQVGGAFQQDGPYAQW
ncbi:hypothetical protein Q6264_31415, partial [Klebsiella pneumoniae]